MATKSITIYRENKTTGEVEKLPVVDLRPRGGIDSVNFHERIIRTYHELEQAGQLREMGPREKQRIRDIHSYAQNPHYWPSDYTKDERGV